MISTRKSRHGSPPLEPESTADPRRGALKRMRFAATSLLVAMTLLFIAASTASKYFAAAAYIKAFAEAGMVGACADWFAVVALFRRPLGLPFPHTAIIPRNKERIGLAIGHFVTNNFLSRSILAEKLHRVDVMRWSSGWLRNQAHGKRAGRQLRVILPKIITALPKSQTVEILAGISFAGLEALPAAPVASKVLSILWAQSETQLLIDRGLELAQTYLIQRQDFVRRKIAEKSSRFIPKWVDSKLADQVMAGVVSTLEDMRSPKHPWRADLRVAVENLITRLANDPVMFQRGEQIKADILKNRLVRDQITRLCQDIESSMTAGVAKRPAAIVSSVELTFAAVGQWLDENQMIQDQINSWLRRAAVQLLLPRRAVIGAYISQVVEAWDSATLVEKIELQIGRDLQYIRINGTLVGGLTGLIIFSLSRWLGAD
jgi:uncharacterized membrane-anchored protein YjiN (DUF445 family)